MKPALDVIAEAMNDELMIYNDDHANAAAIISALRDAGYAVMPMNFDPAPPPPGSRMPQQ